MPSRPCLPKPDPIAKAIYHCFESPNECDSNLEPANIVDGLLAISRAIRYLADAIRTNPK